MRPVIAGTVKNCRYCRSELMHARCVDGLTCATSSGASSSSLSDDEEHDVKFCQFPGPGRSMPRAESPLTIKCRRIINICLGPAGTDS